MYILGTRGGGFEITGLEAISRGVPVIAADKGSWTEYLPEFSLLPSKRSEQVLPGNIFHTGKGYEIDVKRSMDKIVDIIDNVDVYKKKTDGVVEFDKRQCIWKNKENVIKYAYLGDDA